MPILPPHHAPRPPAHGQLHAPPVPTARGNVDVLSTVSPFGPPGIAPRQAPTAQRTNGYLSTASAARVAQAPLRARVDVSSLSPARGTVAVVGARERRLRSRRSANSISSASAASTSHTSSSAARPRVRKTQSYALLGAEAHAAPPVLPPLPSSPPSPVSARSCTVPRPHSPRGLSLRTTSFSDPLGPTTAAYRPSLSSGARRPADQSHSSSLSPRSPPTASSSGAAGAATPDKPPSRSRIPTAAAASVQLERGSLASAPSSVMSSSSKLPDFIPQESPLKHRNASTALPAENDSLEVEYHVGGDADADEEEAKRARMILDLEISNRSLLSINAALEVAKLRQAEEIRELKRRLRVGLELGPESPTSASCKSEGDEVDDKVAEEPVLAALNERCAALVEQMALRARAALAFEPAHGHIGTGGKVLHPCKVAGLRGQDPAVPPCGLEPSNCAPGNVGSPGSTASAGRMMREL